MPTNLINQKADLTLKLFNFLIITILSSCSTSRGPSTRTPTDAKYDQKSNRQLEHFTVSGLSSGAFMAQQIFVTNSDIIDGAASFAGGIYNCSAGQALNALNLCMKTPQNIQVNKSIQYALEQEKKKKISPTSNLKNKKILIFQGLKDPVVNSVAAGKVEEFYKKFQSQIVKEISADSGHGFPSAQGANECHESAKPWMNKCYKGESVFDGAKWVLNEFYGPLNEKTFYKADHIFRVSQKLTRVDGSMLSDYGHVYIPKQCQQDPASCKTHIAIHGCQQNPETVGLEFITQSGYNNWAETNSLIIYYPSVDKSLLNPAGCWDWWGYTSSDFATKDSLQIQSILKTANQIQSDLTNHELQNFILPLTPGDHD